MADAKHSKMLRARVAETATPEQARSTRQVRAEAEAQTQMFGVNSCSFCRSLPG